MDKAGTAAGTLQAALEARYGEAVAVPDEAAVPALQEMARRGSCRAFEGRPVAPEMVRMLAAVALASPSKSDLQQRDIVVVRDPDLRARLDALVAGQAWVAGAPLLLVFCANNRRQRLLHDWRGHAFANDHLDAFLNAAADAAIALGAFVAAAEAVGLGACPISAVRNEAEAVSDLLGLPAHVFPFAGLALGWPAAPPVESPRLPLSVTLHADRYAEDRLREAVEAYDRRRDTVQPYARQRFVERFGTAEAYGWSEDKARQYAAPERADFGAFIRARGFELS